MDQGCLQAKKAAKAAEAHLGNRTNLEEVQKLGAPANVRVAEAFAVGVRPIVINIQAVGVTSLRGIAEVLNALGAQTPRSGDWHARSVAQLLEWGA